MPRPLPIAIAILLVLTSCGPGRDRSVRRPEPPALRVLHTSPDGAVEGPVQIEVVFDRAVVPEGMSEARPGTLQIQPPVAGTLHPVGLSAIVFIPDAPLPPATGFRVEIPEGVLANDGTTLREPVVFHFETARPRVIETLPRNLSSLRNDQPFLFKFDQAVEVAELTRRVQFVVAGQTLPATVVADPADPAYLRVTPTRPLPGGASAEIVIDGSLVGTRGPLSMGRAVRMAFTVHGRPGIASARCEPGGCSQAKVVFQTPLPRDAVVRSLRLEPAANIRLPDDEPRITEVMLTNLRPSTRYRVVLAAGATDIFGQALAQDALADLPVPSLTAEVRPAFVGSVLVPGQARTLPYAAVNVDRATLRLDRVTAAQINGMFRTADPSPATLPAAQAIPLAFGPARDVWQTTNAVIDRVLGTGRGVFAVAVDDGARGASPILVTDIDLAARWTEKGGIVFASSMTNGTPAARARIDLRDDRGRNIGTLTTDAQGLARIPASSVRTTPGAGNELFIIASRDPDLAFVQGSTVSAGVPRLASVISDQRVYARADTIHVKGTFAARPPVPTGAVTVRVSGPGGTFGATQTTASALGTFAVDLEVPDWAVYGAYKVEASGAAGAWTTSTPIEVRAAAVATPHVDVELGRELYMIGQTAVWQVRARHPVRGNLAGAAIDWRVVGRPMEFRPEGWPTFHFGPPEGRPEGAAVVLAEGSGTLGDDGGLAESVRLPSAADTPVRVRIEATVAGAGVGVAETWAHPASLYAGLRATNLPGPDGRVTVDVVAAQPSGRPTRASFQIDAQRHRYELENGRLRPVAEGRLRRCRATTTEQGSGSCRIDLRDPGIYLVTATATDSRGFRAVSSTYVLHEGRAELGATVPVDGALGVPGGPQPAGRSTRVLIASPFEEARALLLVGPEGAEGAQVVTVPRGITAVNVPVTDTMRPFVPVHLYIAGPRGRVIESDANLFVADEDRTLRVAVEPDAADKTPGERLEMRIRVTGADGAPAGSADVTVAVQEAGGSRLSPDPLALLYPDTTVPVVSAALRPSVMRPSARAAPVAASVSAREPAAPAPEAGRTVYWNPHLTTEPDGTAVVRLTLPDVATRYSIVALAIAAGGKGGIGRADVSTSAPIRLQPRVAPVLRSGDETTAILTVVNDTNAMVPVEMTVEASGLGTSLAGPQRLVVPGNNSADLRLDLTTTRAGMARLNIRGTAGNKLLVASPRIQVLAAGEEEVAIRSGRVDGDSSLVGIDVPPDASADEGGLQYTLSLRPAAPAVTIAEEATEPRRQDTASLLESLVARAFLARNARRLGATAPDENSEHAAELARVIGLRVSTDGRARYFPGGPAEVDLGAWVGIGFGAAKRAGIAVPRRAGPSTFRAADAPLVTWARKLQGMPFAPVSQPIAEETPSVTEAALRLLTAPSDDRSALVAIVTSAIQPDLDHPGAETVLPTLAERARGVTPIRATALAVLALLEDEHPDEPLVRGLLALREEGRYRAPLDTVAALLAFEGSLGEDTPRPTPGASASVLVGGSPAAGAEMRAGAIAARGEIPLALLLSARQSTIQIRRRGATPVFFDVVARFRRLAPADDPADHGFAIERVYERVTEGAGGAPVADSSTMPERTQRQFGTDGAIRVHVRLANGLVRRHVVLVDDLPAGCTRVVEAVPSDSSGPFVPVETAPPSRAEFYASELPPGIHHLSYLVRPNHPGRFFAPGATIELLDNPSIWGRAAGDVIAVEGR